MTEFSTRAHARLVRAVAREDSRDSAALFEAVLEGRKEVNLTQWLAILAELDACPLTVAEWLESRKDWL